jgi:hypothetical protein
MAPVIYGGRTSRRLLCAGPITGFALYEAESAERVTIHCERRWWRLVKKDDS